MGPAATGGKRYPLKPQLWNLDDALLPAVTPRHASVFLRDGGELAVVTAVHAAIERGEHATFATAPPAALGRRCCGGPRASTRRSYRTAATTGWRRWGRRGRGHRATDERYVHFWGKCHSYVTLLLLRRIVETGSGHCFHFIIRTPFILLPRLVRMQLPWHTPRPPFLQWHESRPPIPTSPPQPTPSRSRLPP